MIGPTGAVSMMGAHERGVPPQFRFPSASKARTRPSSDAAKITCWSTIGVEELDGPMAADHFGVHTVSKLHSGVLLATVAA